MVNIDKKFDNIEIKFFFHKKEKWKCCIEKIIYKSHQKVLIVILFCFKIDNFVYKIETCEI